MEKFKDILFLQSEKMVEKDSLFLDGQLLDGNNPDRAVAYGILTQTNGKCRAKTPSIEAYTKHTKEGYVHWLHATTNELDELGRRIPFMSCIVRESSLTNEQWLTEVERLLEQHGYTIQRQSILDVITPQKKGWIFSRNRKKGCGGSVGVALLFVVLASCLIYYGIK